jgi:uncharacterized protein
MSHESFIRNPGVMTHDSRLATESRPLFPLPRNLWGWLQVPLTWPMIGLIRLYQLLISPALPPSCRFAPSCSRYTLEAIQRYGALKGGWLGARRLVRCHPWNPGGFDPVP